MTTYKAGSLAEIAEEFESMADRAAKASERSNTERDRLLFIREKNTWTLAAQILRDTTLEPTNAA